MKGQALTIIFFGSILLWSCEDLYAWENKKTHPAITNEAIDFSNLDNFLKNQLSLSDGLITELYWNFPPDIKERIDRGKAFPEQTTRSVSEWIRTGSIIEDEDGRRIAPWRPRHHFHDPIRNSGLDNHTDHPDWDCLFAFVGYEIGVF
jgi:hypothetical protein